MCLSFELIAAEASVKQAMLGAVLLTGALLPCVLGDLVVLSELWAGILVALSAVCFGLKRPAVGVLAGLAALFFRELAAPYCVVCIALAIYDRRPRELGIWAVGLAAYGLFYALHVQQVLPRITSDDIAPRQRLASLRRGGLFDLDGRDERLPAVAAAMDHGHLSGLHLAGLGKLDVAGRAIDRTDDCRVCDRIQHRGARFQSILGLDHGTAVLSRGMPVSHDDGHLWRTVGLSAFKMPPSADSFDRD